MVGASAGAVSDALPLGSFREMQSATPGAFPNLSKGDQLMDQDQIVQCMGLIERESVRQSGMIELKQASTERDKWSMAEFMCGVATLSAAYAELGIGVGGLCEKQADLLEVVSRGFRGAQLAEDISARDWSTWKRSDDLEVVVGGPMCNPFSTAGKLQGGTHEQADQIYFMEEAASEMGARWLQIENVPNLLVSFKHFFEEFVSHCERRDWVFLGAECLCHAELGGTTRRKRIWPTFEKIEVALKLPPWRLFEGSIRASSIREKISEKEGPVSPLGTYEAWASPVKGEAGVVRAGTFWMGGPGCSDLCRGSRVKLLPDQDGKVVAVHKGVCVSLCAEKEVFTVLEIEEGKVKLLHDNRASPLWLWRSRSEIREICRKDFPVFSLDGTGPTIRSMRVPPGENGFLVFDDRSPPGRVRPLSGEELWKLQGLNLELAHRLRKADFSWERIGELAGSSIPREMCRVQARRLSKRVDRARRLERLEKALGVPWLHGDAPSISRPGFVKTILCLIHTSDEIRLLVDEAMEAVPGVCVVQKVSAESSVQSAERWAASLMQVDLVGFLAAEKSVNGVLSRVVVVPIREKRGETGAGLRWASVKELREADSCLGDMLLLVVARLASFGSISHMLGPLAIRSRDVSQKRFRWRASEEGIWKEGRTPVMMVEPVTFGSSTECSRPDWSAVVEKLVADQNDLKGALRAFPVDHPAYAWLQETADAMKPVDVEEFPIELLKRSLGDVSREMAVKMPFPDEYKPPVTEWLPRRAQQKSPPVGFKPRSIADLVSSEGLRRLEDWSLKAAKDLSRMHKLGAAAGRQHKEVLALSQEDLVPEARGIFWDLRKAREGIIAPIDFAAQMETHLDLEYLRNLCECGPLKDYPDQQLISQLMLGVRYRGELEMQIVLLPHLISFGHGCVGIQKEMLELEERGWYSFHDTIPFVPFRNIPRGATVKQDGSWRPTSELGAPRVKVWDKAGNEVVSHNAAIAKAEWFKESKPTMGEFLQALGVMMVMASLASEPIFFFSDDMQKMFNQLVLAPEEQWTAGSFLLGKEGAPLWASERVMPFGVKCGSNIAQAWAHLVLFLVRDTMERMEAASSDPNKILVEILKERSEHWKSPEQARAFYSVMYTDDSATAVIGILRTIRFLCAWFEVITRFNILMAPPRKRQLGCKLSWVGGIVLASGVVTVALQKRIRAIQELKRLLASKMTVSALRKLMGLLEHFIFILAFKRNLVAALYEPLKGEGSEENPDLLVLPSKAMCSTAARLVKVIASSAGNFVSAFTTESSPLSSQSRVVSWHSDAAREKYFVAHKRALVELDGEMVGIGLGGYAAGYWWNWPLSDEAHGLHISSLEALAFALNFFVFGSLVEEIVGPKTALLTHCDALASVMAVAFGRSKAPLLKHVFELLDEVPAFKKLKRFTATTHVAGPGNLMADAASRGKVQVIRDFTAQIGITPIKRKLNQSALEFINKTVAYARKLSLVEQSLGIEQPNTPDSASFPQFVIPRMVSDDGRVLENDQIGLGPAGGDYSEPRGPIGPQAIPRMVSCSGIVIDQAQDARDTEQAQKKPKLVIEQCKVLVLKSETQRPAQLEGVKKLSVLQQGRREALEGLSSTVARSVSEALASETCLQQPGLVMNEMIHGMFKAVLDTVPEGTKVVDARDWELWCGVMRDLGVAPWRGDMAAHRGLDMGGYWREVMLQAIAFYRCLKDVKPRKRRFNPQGNMIPAKPESVTVVKSVRRIHKYFGIMMAESKLYSNLLKAANTVFIEENGLSALMPHRKEPFTNPQIRRMLALPEGLVVNGRRVDAGSRLWRSIDLLMRVQAQTGFRLGDALRMNRDALRFEIKGSVLPMIDELVRPMIGEGAFAIVTPQRTKSDPLGTYWSPHPVYLEASGNDIIGAGGALFRYELDFNIPLVERHKIPMFTDNEGLRLMRPALERVLRDILLFIGADPDKHSWHSFRIYLAVALKQAGADDSRIKAMVRWVSDKSLRIYARDSKQEYTNWLRKAAEAEVDTVYVQSLPDIDEDRVMAALKDLLAGDIES